MRSKKLVIALLLVFALFTFAACGTGTSGYNNLTPNDTNGVTDYNAPGGSVPGDVYDVDDADRNVTKDGTRDTLDNLDDNSKIKP